MKMKSFLLSALVLAGGLSAFAQTTPKLTLQLGKAEKTVSPMLYGLMTEEINYSYEGGLYAQLVRNPSFKEFVTNNRRNWSPARSVKPAFWTMTDSLSATMSVDKKEFINEANNASLRLEIKESGKDIGLTNEGYWGYPIRPLTTYNGSLFIKTKPGSSPSIKISLASKDGKTIFASTQISNITDQWKKYDYQLKTSDKTTITSDACLTITTNEAGTYWLSRITLFPPTYNNRGNGLRPNLMTMMKNMNPKFLRFPGGNYVEGNTFADRFDWKSTIGNPDERPGHNSPWGYRSNDGLGLLEYLEWIEDLGGEPVLAVFAGYTLNGDHLTGEYLKPFVQDALDEIEYVIGGPDTKWGAQRVKDGHPQPFKLKYIEIGNEDFFDRTGSYTERYQQFYDAIKAQYPQLELISTMTTQFNWYETNMNKVKIDIMDEHFYRSAIDMYRNAFQYDSYDRKGPKIFCGEWATREGDPTTNMNAALGDAVWMACMERNSDLVIMSCYAPMMVNVNPGGMQWKSDLIGYNTLNSYGSPSYYAQCMFGNYLGDKIIPIKGENIPTFKTPLSQRDSLMKVEPIDIPEIYYVATKDSHTGNVFLKVINVVGKSQTVDFNIEGASGIQSKAIKVELKSAHPEDTNTIDQPKNIVPVTSKAKVSKAFKCTLAPYSITILKISTK